MFLSFAAVLNHKPALTEDMGAGKLCFVRAQGAPYMYDFWDQFSYEGEGRVKEGSILLA